MLECFSGISSATRLKSPLDPLTFPRKNAGNLQTGQNCNSRRITWNKPGAKTIVKESVYRET